MAGQLIICGMHRSGTSLVASALQRAGVDIGRDLAVPMPGNPRGHFEDADFHGFHESMLAAAGETCFTAGNGFAPRASADFERRARALAAAREALPLWGWKDPRTCLFLDFWDGILPQARYLFLYRHPVDVALSLLRRNTDPELRQNPWLAVSAWESYNVRLLEFRRRHADRVFLARVPERAADLGALLRRLSAKLGLPLQDGDAASVFAPRELTPHTPPSPAWEELIPGALELYSRLEAEADLPAGEAAAHADQLTAREAELLRTHESLLYTLLERLARGGPTPVHELRRAFLHEQAQEAAIHELERALAVERQRAEELSAAHGGERRGRLQLQAELENVHREAARLAAALRDERVERAKAEARAVALAQTLGAIEASRSFAPIRAWWWIRSRLGRQRA